MTKFKVLRVKFFTDFGLSWSFKHVKNTFWTTINRLTLEKKNVYTKKLETRFGYYLQISTYVNVFVMEGKWGKFEVHLKREQNSLCVYVIISIVAYIPAQCIESIPMYTARTHHTGSYSPYAHNNIKILSFISYTLLQIGFLLSSVHKPQLLDPLKNFKLTDFWRYFHQNGSARTQSTCHSRHFISVYVGTV